MSGDGPRKEFTDEEARRRFEATLKGALKTPPKPHKPKEGATPSSKRKAPREK